LPRQGIRLLASASQLSGSSDASTQSSTQTRNQAGRIRPLSRSPRQPWSTACRTPGGPSRWWRPMSPHAAEAATSGHPRDRGWEARRLTHHQPHGSVGTNGQAARFDAIAGRIADNPVMQRKGWVVTSGYGRIHSSPLSRVLPSH